MVLSAFGSHISLHNTATCETEVSSESIDDVIKQFSKLYDIFEVSEDSTQVVSKARILNPLSSQPAHLDELVSLKYIRENFVSASPSVLDIGHKRIVNVVDAKEPHDVINLKMLNSTWVEIMKIIQNETVHLNINSDCLSAHKKRICDVGEPKSMSDAVTVKYMQDYIASILLKIK